MNILQLKRQLLPMSGPQMAGGGGSTGSGTSYTDVAPWARGYAKSNLEKGAALADQPYQAYDPNKQRIAGFDPMQTKAQENAAAMQTDVALGTGITTAQNAANKGLSTTYDNTTFKNQFAAPEAYKNTSFAADQVSAPELQNYQMTGPKDVAAQKFTGGSAQDYMSPYMQNVVDTQQREAQRQADIASTSRGAQAVKSGAFGGSRQAIMDAEAARNLATQKGDIQAAGLQSAYKQAQDQFNADQARQMQADLANQGMGYNVGAQNLGANLATQALGSGQKMQAGLANQGANLQAAGMGEQSKQYGYGQGMTAAQLAAQYGLSADQLSEQSKQYGAGLQMQGLNTAISGATAAGNMGNTRFQQGMDINKLQNAYGGQKQDLRQRGLTQEYNDWLEQKNYPYKQVSWMSDLIRGTPTGSITTKNMYEPGASGAQQGAATAMGMYGLSKYMANGGMAYADGGYVPGYSGDNGSVVGEGVDSEDNVAAIVHTLSDADLQKAMQAAQVRGDQDQLDAIKDEMAMRASLKNGIAGGVTDTMATRMAAGGGLMGSYAGGGAVAFSTGGLNDYMRSISDAASEDIADTPEQRLAGIKGALPGIKELYGESALKPFAEDIKKDRDRLATQKTQNEGLAWLAGAEALVRPGSKGRAVTGSFAAIGKGLAAAEKDFTDANTKLRQAEMTLASAEQARTDGQIGKAESLYDKGREDKKEALKRKLDANEKLATIQASVDNSIRQTGAQMAQVNKPGETERMLADIDAIRTGKKDFQGLKGEEGVKAYQDAVGQLGAARYGVKYTGQNKDFEHRKAVLDVLQKDEGVKIAQMKVAQLEAKEKLSAKEQAALDANKAFLQKRYDSVSTDLQKAGGAAPGGGNTKVISMADIQRTAESSGRTVEEVRAAAAAKGYTIQ